MFDHPEIHPFPYDKTKYNPTSYLLPLTGHVMN